MEIQCDRKYVIYAPYGQPRRLSLRFTAGVKQLYAPYLHALKALIEYCLVIEPVHYLARRGIHIEMRFGITELRHYGDSALIGLKRAAIKCTVTVMP